MGERLDDLSDYAAYQADQEVLVKASLEALQASRTRPLTEEEQMTLAWSAGLAGAFYKEIK
jgi:hypothetical protein